MSGINELEQHITLEEKSVRFLNFLNNKLSKCIAEIDCSTFERMILSTVVAISQHQGNSYTADHAEELINTRTVAKNYTVDEANQIVNLSSVLQHISLNPDEHLNQDTLVEYHSKLKLNMSTYPFGRKPLDKEVNLDDFNRGIYNDKLPYKSIGVISDYCNTIECPYEKAIYLLTRINSIKTVHYGCSGLPHVLAALSLSQNKVMPLMPNSYSLHMHDRYLSNATDSTIDTSMSQWFLESYTNQFSNLLGVTAEQLRDEFNQS